MAGQGLTLASMPTELLLPLLLSALLALGRVQGALLVDESFDAHPLTASQTPYQEHLFSTDPEHTKVELRPCPERNAEDDGPDYASCLYMELERCENSDAPDKGGCFRNEIGLQDSPALFAEGEEYWVGLSTYTTEHTVDELKTVYFQIKAQGGGDFKPGGPALSLLAIHGYWAITVRGSSTCDVKCSLDSTVFQFLGPVVAGEWVDFVINFKVSTDTRAPGRVAVYMNGFKIWENSNLLVGYRNPHGFGLFMKWGLYKHHWGEGVFHSVGFDDNHVSQSMSAIRVAHGADMFLAVDTAPKRCTSIATCCPTSCPKSKSLHNAARCRKFCTADPQNPLCQVTAPASECSGLRSCCKPCINNAPNPKYNLQRCFDRCRKYEANGKAFGSRRRKVKRYGKFCFPLGTMGQQGCGNAITCDASTQATCRHDAHTFGCSCPNGRPIDNRQGMACE